MAAITSRYARAFADVVFDLKLVPASVLEQLYGIVSVCKSNQVLQRIWENPSVPAEQKRALLDAIVARENVCKQARNFLAVLIDHRRIGELPAMVRQVESELDTRQGFAEAEVTSARELSAGEKGAHRIGRRRQRGERARSCATSRCASGSSGYCAAMRSA